MLHCAFAVLLMRVIPRDGIQGSLLTSGSVKVSPANAGSELSNKALAVLLKVN